MAAPYYYNQQQQQQLGGIPSMQQQPQPPPPQRAMPGQVGINPTQSHYLQQQYRNQPINDAGRKRAHSKAGRQNASIMEDADEPSGDELDDISARDIAMARYKRNHDYLSEIFTPYNAAHIVTPALDISQSKEELEKQIEECKERDIQQKKKMEEKLASIESEQEKFWKCINQLKNATTLESIEEVTKNITKELGIEIKHRTNNVNILSIPELEKQEEKEKEALLLQQQQQQQALIENANNQRQQTMEEVISNNIASQGMDMYFNQREDEAETADSFFNEMVNTDDDPAVSEFLNTE